MDDNELDMETDIITEDPKWDAAESLEDKADMLQDALMKKLYDELKQPGINPAIGALVRALVKDIKAKPAGKKQTLEEEELEDVINRLPNYSRR